MKKYSHYSKFLEPSTGVLYALRDGNFFCRGVRCTSLKDLPCVHNPELFYSCCLTKLKVPLHSTQLPQPTVWVGEHCALSVRPIGWHADQVSPCGLTNRSSQSNYDLVWVYEPAFCVSFKLLGEVQPIPAPIMPSKSHFENILMSSYFQKPDNFIVCHCKSKKKASLNQRHSNR